jgi:hypothetical protein
VFAHISDDGVGDWQSSIDIVLRRFAEYHELEGAFGRRALTERAKGILMERHSIDENSAFEMLRERSRLDNRKLIDLAAAVVDGHRPTPQAAAGSRLALTLKQLAQPGDSHRRERPGPRRAERDHEQTAALEVATRAFTHQAPATADVGGPRALSSRLRAPIDKTLSMWPARCSPGIPATGADTSVSAHRVPRSGTSWWRTRSGCLTVPCFLPRKGPPVSGEVPETGVIRLGGRKVVRL